MGSDQVKPGAAPSGGAEVGDSGVFRRPEQRVAAAGKTPAGVRGPAVCASPPVSLRWERLAIFITWRSTLARPLFTLATPWAVFTAWIL